MNNQNVPKIVEVSKQQYTDMNVDVPEEMHTPVPYHVLAQRDTVEQQRQGQRFEGYKSQYTGSEQNSVGCATGVWTGADDSEDAVGAEFQRPDKRQSSGSVPHVVANYPTVEREHPPRTDDHAVVSEVPDGESASTALETTTKWLWRSRERTKEEQCQLQATEEKVHQDQEKHIFALNHTWGRKECHFVEKGKQGDRGEVDQARRSEKRYERLLDLTPSSPPPLTPKKKSRFWQRPPPMSMTVDPISAGHKPCAGRRRHIFFAPGVVLDIRKGQLSETWSGGRFQNRLFFLREEVQIQKSPKPRRTRLRGAPEAHQERVKLAPGWS